MARQLKKRQVVKQIVKKSQASQQNASRAKQASGTEIKAPSGTFTEGIGRRKVATARVRIYDQPGDFIVNGKAAGQYFSTTINSQTEYNRPFVVTGTKGKFAVTAKVSGSGAAAQLEAMVHGLARALEAYNPEWRSLLKEAGLLTRDDRMKESRKIGMGGKARRKRQSPRR